MTSHVYVGPSDSVLLPDGKRAYHPGDSIPLTKDQKAGLERSGHRFSDTDAEAVAATGIAQPLPDQRPRGDRGEVLDIPDAHPTATDARAEARTTATPPFTSAASKSE